MAAIFQIIPWYQVCPTCLDVRKNLIYFALCRLSRTSTRMDQNDYKYLLHSWRAIFYPGILTAFRTAIPLYWTGKRNLLPVYCLRVSSMCIPRSEKAILTLFSYIDFFFISKRIFCLLRFENKWGSWFYF